MAAEVVLGIDGGGTKTVCLAADREGRILGRGVSGPSNYLSEGLYTAKTSLRIAIESALREGKLSNHQIVAACAGLAGVSRRKDHETMQKVLEELLPESALLTL
ncbi:MAG TPA: BadF/BadG/BcrA/BcrD ATPase family protein, partial [Acidobacteriota bacterium]|nr:BadF/BadG/BcrA/BcrD ATPase family protein [Acidobacteriota bacterium]